MSFYNTMSQMQFIFPVHAKESNTASQRILDANRDHFSRQCRVIFDLLMNDGTINSHTAVVEYQIVDLRRRLVDLKESGVSLSWAPSENGRTKNWYMSSQDKINNQRFI